MKCPICNDVRMKAVVKDGVEIDLCPECKGVWLDRGELEKLLQGVNEVRQDYERMEQHMQQNSALYGGGAPASGTAFGQAQPSSGYGQPPFGSQGSGQQGYGNQGFGQQGQSNQSFSQPAQNGQAFGQPSYGQPQQGGFGAPPASGQNYSQPPSGYSGSQSSKPGYPPNYNQPGYNQSHSHSQSHNQGYGYNKHHSSYKKKKTVLDIFGDLFE
ncbi:zf-TFIIB domain-containing protein [Paenibacillus sp. GCM10027627]|uniref:TFIIB-type zinc ribbon-containing protein n=1 Tax=unclassified Paenibacillus TaxID=185978 RepID=UPI00363E6B54